MGLSFNHHCPYCDKEIKDNESRVMIKSSFGPIILVHRKCRDQKAQENKEKEKK